LQIQSDPDYEQLIIEDKKSRGYLWANTRIANLAYDKRIKGQYVYVLDADDFIIKIDFIESLKKIIDRQYILPQVVVFKGFINDQLFPKIWQQAPVRGSIGSPNFMAQRNMFFQYARAWEQSRAGDFEFIRHCWQDRLNFLWWDQTVFHAG
jgi:glycosyltransferase involved in cell wall biosynthesis